MNHFYQEMQRSTEVWLGDVPSQWRSFRIKDVARLSPNFQNGTPEINELCSVIPMEKVSEKGEINSDIIEEYNLISSGLTSFEAGDVIFAKITPCMENGKGAYIAKLPTQYAFGSTEFHVLRPRQMVDGKFIYYYTYNSVYRDYAETNMTGAAGQKRVSSRFINYTRIFLPDIAVQQRIAAYLDKTCAAIDKAIEAKQKQLQILDALRKSIIHKAVTRGLDDSVGLKESGVEWLGRIPKHWLTTQLKQVSTLQSGITLGKTYGGKLIERPYLRVANVQDGYFELEKITTFFLPESEAKRTELRKGDVLMTEGGDLDKLGRGHMWDGQISNCLHQNHIFAIRCNIAKLLPEYLTFITSSGYGRAYFEATGKRTTNLASTNATKIRSFRIPIPSLAEQTAIIENLMKMKKQSDKLQENIYSQISTLNQYHKSLIHELVTGKRQVSKDDCVEKYELN